MINVSGIRNLILGKYQDILLGKDEYVMSGKTRTVELLGATFVADEPAIIGDPNLDYINREIEWYESQSLNVNDIPGQVPKIWTQVSDNNGFINSNYGWCIWSPANHYQYYSALAQLKADKNTRKAEMIYTRPSIQHEHNKNGMSDFICTDSVSYFIRGNTLIAHVKMRSNDVFHGYRNDVAWQNYVLSKLKLDLSDDVLIESTQIIWTASSLHVYERHFGFLNKYLIMS